MNNLIDLKTFSIFFILSLNLYAQMPDSIVVKIADFSIERPYGVDCNNFDRDLKGHISKFTLKNKSQIAILLKHIAALQQDSTKYEPDIRLRMVLFKDNKKYGVLCMNHLGVIYNGISYYYSTELHRLLCKISGKYRHLSKLK